MTDWTPQDLTTIAQADDLHIAPFRDDGVTYGTPTWIWSVVVEGGLFVRAYHGQKSRWYRAALGQKAGRISVAGMRREVAFTLETGGLNERIDAAYRAKYAASPYLAHMVAAGPRAATVRITPLD